MPFNATFFRCAQCEFLLIAGFMLQSASGLPAGSAFFLEVNSP